MKNLFSVEGKVALVTGGSSGIGEMIAAGYVAAGVKTYIASRKMDVCQAVADKLSENGTCIPLQADLSNMDGVQGLAAAMAEREAALDILVNNSGANWAAPYAEYPESGWDRVMDLNTKAVFFLTRDLTPLLRKASERRPPARVINISSVDAVKVPELEIFAYSPSKAATLHLTKMLAKHLAPDITVNAILPGAFPSRMMRQTIETGGDQLIEDTPMRRLGKPEDMAGVAIYLASEAGSYVTAAQIAVDGGMLTVG